MIQISSFYSSKPNIPFFKQTIKRSFRKLQFFVHLEQPKKMTSLGLGLLPFWNQIFYTIMVRYNSGSIYVNNKCQLFNDHPKFECSCVPIRHREPELGHLHCILNVHKIIKTHLFSMRNRVHETLVFFKGRLHPFFKYGMELNVKI